MTPVNSHSRPRSKHTQRAEPTLGNLLNDWYDTAARPLPWRKPGTSPWGILLSEVMAQQTPVSRVEPLWIMWMSRWPHPAALADAPVNEVLQAWANLGYPRRALRLRECAQQIVEKHHGAVPATIQELLDLPGIGEYTARAIAAFSFGEAVPVVDTNVRRVHRRLVLGEFLQGPAKTRDLVDIADLMPWVDEDPDLSRRHYVNPAHDPAYRDEALGMCFSLMELGAAICTARSPKCSSCPVSSRCRWLALGRPEPTDAARAEAKRRVQKFEGTDRQVRGRIMAVLREHGSANGFPHAAPEKLQRDRALASLVADGLVEQYDGGYRLPR